jgi:hypothetical protein
MPIPGWAAPGCEPRPCLIKFGSSAAPAGQAAAGQHQNFDPSSLRPPSEAFSLNKLPHNCPLTVMLARQHRNITLAQETQPMSSLDLDLDAHMNNLEMEWRQAYESSIVARADYQSLAASPKANADLLDLARERLDRTEALKARIMAKIERLEDSMLGQD